jgi:integrase
MHAKKPHTPAYRLHKARGLAVVTIDGRDHYLGPYGSAESREQYDRLIAEWLANGRRLPRCGDKNDDPGPTVNEVMLGFMRHAERHYRRTDGTQTTEVKEYARAFGPLRRLYGRSPARDFGPMALKAVRQEMIAAGLSRGVINQRIGRVRRLFKWGVENELVPPPVYQALLAVPGLQRGRTEARETEPVTPVSLDAVEATLPHANRHVRAMVPLQLLTGARPGEVCVMRACDIDMSGPVWLYRPGSDRGPAGQHKTAHHGHQRVIPVGPRAQEVIRPFLKLDTRAFLFSPSEAMAELRAERRGTRKTPVQPSQKCRRKRTPKRAPGERYTSHAYAHAIEKACARAFPPPEPLAKGEDETAAVWAARLTDEQRAELGRWRREHSWHPNQLRHARATDVRRRYGLEAAQVVLGHANADVTQVYAERNLTLAERVAAEIG